MPSPATETFIKVSNGQVHSRFEVKYKKFENGMYSFYIPGYNIRFSAGSKEDGVTRAKFMVDCFFKYWIKGNSFRSFILELHKLGFKADKHNLTVKNLLSKKIKTAKFKPSIIKLNHPNEYNKSVQSETKLSAA